MIAKSAFLISIFFALLSLFPAQADADPSTEARVLYQKGNAAFLANDDVMAREYYRRSLELEDSFDTLCNLGRAEARSKLFAEAYEHLRLCVHLYPEDAELASAKGKFAALRDEVRKELSFEEAKPIDDRVDEDLKRRQAALEEASAEASQDPADDGVGAADPSTTEPPVTVVERRKWKLPVVLSLVGVGLVGAGFGTVMLIQSSGLKNKADDLREGLSSDSCSGSDAASECSEIKSNLEKSDTAFTMGVAGLAAGGAFLASSLVVALLVPGKKTTSASPSAGVHIHPSGSGGSLRGFSLRPVFALAPSGGGWHLGISGNF